MIDLNSKPSNPKDTLGIQRVPSFSVIPRQVVAEVGLALLEGACKYGRHNYRVAGVRASVYMDAVDRHISAFWEGQDIDPDSGLSHVTKAIAGLVVLRDSMIQGNWVDDRPPIVRNPNWISECNKTALEILGKYPEPKVPFTNENSRSV